MMYTINSMLLKDMAHYIWWEKPDVAVQDPYRLIAQVMNMGLMDDVLRVLHECGRDCLKDIIKNAEPGWFTPKSWNFWHIFLRISQYNNVPALPERNVATFQFDKNSFEAFMKSRLS